jgi:hypothetical protein
MAVAICAAIIKPLDGFYLFCDRALTFDDANMRAFGTEIRCTGWG